LYKVYRSTDGGGTWESRNSYLSSVKLNTLLLSNTVYGSLDVCNFWGSVPAYYNQGWYDNVIAVDPLDPDKVWAGGIDLFRSDNGGVDWGQASHWWADKSNGGYVHADQHAIAFHPDYNGTSNQIMFVANDGGVHRTDNARANVDDSTTAPCDPTVQTGEVAWTELNNNFGVTQFYYGVPYPGGATYFGGTQDNGTLRGNDTDGSEEWEELLGGDGGAVAVDSGNTNVLYGEYTGLSIRKSTDGGVTFNPAVNGISESPSNFLFIAPFNMDPTDSSTLWTGGAYLWRTTNSAANWNRASDFLEVRVSAVASSPVDGNSVAAGTTDGCIRTTNVGLSATGTTTWPVTCPRSGYVSSVAWDPSMQETLYATYSTFGGGAHVWKSIDNGANWSPIDGSGLGALPDIPVHSIVIHPTDSLQLYIGTDIGVFSSTDGGTTWAVENTGFANVITEILAIDDTSSRIFAFTHGRGAWRVPLPAGCSVRDAEILLNNASVNATETYQACARIAVGEGGPVTVTGTGELILQSGGSIEFFGGDGINAGFSVDGGVLRATAGSLP
jgi:hypothetical protein